MRGLWVVNCVLGIDEVQWKSKGGLLPVTAALSLVKGKCVFSFIWIDLFIHSFITKARNKLVCTITTEHWKKHVHKNDKNTKKNFKTQNA